MSAYLATVFINIGIYMILALGLNIIVGYAGQISLGHAAFWAIGAYAFAILTTKFAVPFFLSAVIAIFIAAFIGILLGLPSLRVRNDALAIITIGINFIVQAIFRYNNFFGGTMGIGSIPFPEFESKVISLNEFLILTYFMVFAVILISYIFKRSRAYTASSAIKQNELAADMIGINPSFFKILAFGLGGATAGIAGVLYASFIGFIAPDDFSFITSVSILSMVMIGGENTIIGPLFGAFLLILLPEIFQPIQNYSLLLYGGLLLAIMRFQPAGIFGKGGIVWKLIKKNNV